MNNMTKNKHDYKEYVPGSSFAEAFETDKIPMMQMAHLRNLDYQISRHLSYERTVDEFLLQLAVNDSLHALKIRRDLVILLNEEGALVREDGKWILLFTPQCAEGASLREDAPLYPVFRSLLKKEKEGTVCRIRVPERSMKALVSGKNPFSILDEYCMSQPGGYLAIAEQIVFAGPEELYRHVPVCHYNALATVDRDEIENYQTIRALLDDYILQCDSMQPGDRLQPLSIAVFGPPGAGKSFGVKQIASTSGRFAVTSLNVSQYKGPAALFEAMVEALNCPKGSIPLIFFDEFDSELDSEARGWLKYFLAPMQDGEYTLNGRTRSIDDAVFVFAGGTAESFRQFLPSDQSGQAEAFRKVKGPDFVSRLKGILNIKGLNPVSITDRSHIIRRATLLREQIIRRIPGIYNSDGGLINISKGLLSALLRVSEYRHGARSLEFILSMCRLSDVNRFTPSCLPMDEQLDLHLDVKDFRNKLAFEQVMGDAVEQYARIAHMNILKKHPWAEKAAAERSLQQAGRDVTFSEALSTSAMSAGEISMTYETVRCPDEFAPWSDLEECYKESYRSQIRFLGEKLQDYDMQIGLRPIAGSGAPDAITELFGPVLEEFARLEHERWMRDRRIAGWTAGSPNADLKQTPELVPYDELDEMTRSFIRMQVREIPGQLREIGYELYFKWK
jgi:hypothetical protein